jgi:hypothetical protein
MVRAVMPSVFYFTWVAVKKFGEQECSFLFIVASTRKDPGVNVIKLFSFVTDDEA